MRSIYLLTISAALAAFCLAAPASKSGIPVGGEVLAFQPHHLTGADAGTDTCPVCKYGATPAVQVWVNGDDLSNVGKLAKALDKRIQEAGTSHLKTFFVFLDPSVKAKLPKLAKDLNLHYVAFTYVDGPNTEWAKEYEINGSKSISNTVMVYSNRTVVSNITNLKADKSGLDKLQNAVSEALAKQS
jgi:protocatechuate 3,4-dioxygenase beta subunit